MDDLQFGVEVPVSRDSLCTSLPKEIPKGARSEEQTPDRHKDEPYVQEARSEVETDRAEWSPALGVTT